MILKVMLLYICKDADDVWLTILELFPSRTKQHFVQEYDIEVHSTGTSENNTPWKINMEPKNHQFREENDLPNLHDYVPC